MFILCICTLSKLPCIECICIGLSPNLLCYVALFICYEFLNFCQFYSEVHKDNLAFSYAIVHFMCISVYHVTQILTKLCILYCICYAYCKKIYSIFGTFTVSTFTLKPSDAFIGVKLAFRYLDHRCNIQENSFLIILREFDLCIHVEPPPNLNTNLD